MSVSQIVTAIGAQLETNGVTAPVFFGGEHLAALSAPPRLVFVPLGGEGGPAEKGGYEPRPLRTRNVRVEVHCWAADYDAAEELFNGVAAAVHQVARGSYDFVDEKWPELNGKLLALGRIIIGTFIFRIPVTAPPKATGVVTSIPQTTQLER